MSFTANEWTDDNIVLGLRMRAAREPDGGDLLLAAAERIAGPELSVDLVSNTIVANGQLIRLTKRQAEIMEVLRSMRRMTPQSIYESVWPITEDLARPRKTVGVHVHAINCALEGTGYRILGFWGEGYQLTRVVGGPRDGSSADGLDFDPIGGTVAIHNRAARLSPIQTKMMAMLHTGRQVPMDELRRAVWPPERRIKDPRKQLNVYAYNINNKIKRLGLRIYAEWGRGYQLRRMKSDE